MNRNIKVLLLTAVLLMSATSSAQSELPDGEEILRAIDRNMNSDTRIIESTMIVHGRRGTRNISSRSWATRDGNSFTEYLSPAREKGTKMLKLDDNLWTYSPRTDRVIQISGHLLRQSVMGSDLSYEDMMENDELLESYSAVVEGSESIDGRDCWVVNLIGTKDDLAYAKRKIWVDKERFLALREERFAKSGKLLKSSAIDEVMQLGDRWYPKRLTFKDELKSGDGTEWIIDSIELDVDIPSVKFSKASLRK